MNSEYEPWGRYPITRQHGVQVAWRSDVLPLARPLLPFGRGRSYGDVAQNTDGVLLGTRFLDRLIRFDRNQGVLEAEAGISLADIHRVTATNGWYLPVVPGTQYISLGGAIANDVHGKNHHVAGTFGEHVECLELLRTDGARMLCSRDANADWFYATIGGLGLTGLITRARVALRRLPCGEVVTATKAFSSVQEFIELCDGADSTHEFTVAWFDCFSYGSGRFRGLFTRGNLAPEERGGFAAAGKSPVVVPVTPPFDLLSPWAMRVFNHLYFALNRMRKESEHRTPLQSFFYPLDIVGHWNRLYGPKGFMQLQCAIPTVAATAGINELLNTISRARQGTFLAVLKRFGSRKAPGLMSFPLEGLTLALDFPFRGPETLTLFQRFHEIVNAHGGRLYPAKDACMSPATFSKGFPRWQELVPYVDVGFRSDFWRRVTG